MPSGQAASLYPTTNSPAVTPHLDCGDGGPYHPVLDPYFIPLGFYSYDEVHDHDLSDT
jgi:hypothetical protein